MNDYVKKMLIAKRKLEAIGFTETAETKQSGIYLYERADESGIRFFYVGQAKNLYSRQIGHLMGYKQKIDLSIKKRGLKCANNPYGWQFNIIEYCPDERLNEREQYYIRKYISEGRQAYNLTLGSQGDDKVYLDNKKAPKGYYDGLAQGRKNALREVSKLFDKNLVVMINGKSNKNKEKAMAKFLAMIVDKEVLNERLDSPTSNNA